MFLDITLLSLFCLLDSCVLFSVSLGNATRIICSLEVRSWRLYTLLSATDLWKTKFDTGNKSRMFSRPYLFAIVISCAKVSWSVRESEFRDQVEASEGRVRFASGVQQQDLVITMKNDAVSIP